ncbi:MAG: hypothetical protein JKY48_12450 [Flavobacteriales bacterium]|nr:hypothetical protein [Flavobacteriales bacterium]
MSIGFLDSGKSFGLDKLKLIVDNYDDLSLDWLIFDEGEMIVEASDKKGMMKPMPKKSFKTIPVKAVLSKKMIPHVVTVDSEGNENISLVRSKVAAGYATGFMEPEFISSLPDLNNSTFRMFEVNGNSMLPTLHSLILLLESLLKI